MRIALTAVAVVVAVSCIDGPTLPEAQDAPAVLQMDRDQHTARQIGPGFPPQDRTFPALVTQHQPKYASRVLACLRVRWRHAPDRCTCWREESGQPAHAGPTFSVPGSGEPLGEMEGVFRLRYAGRICVELSPGAESVPAITPESVPPR